MDPKSAAHLLFEFLFNPFTVAAVNPTNGDVTFVARHRGGPMTAALARLAGGTKLLGGPTASQTINAEPSKVPLSIEGPYGVSTRFPQLSSGEFDRILLVAGGIGATFTVPIYRAIVNENPSTRVEMIWAVRTAGDATWAVTGNKNLLNDENVQIFLTGDDLGRGGDDGNGSGAEQRSGDVEMSSMRRDRRRGIVTAQHNRKRPDLRKIVDGVFAHGADERVAVLVCGPEEMSKELRGYVGSWVRRGRVVWWHKEGFGF